MKHSILTIILLFLVTSCYDKHKNVLLKDKIAINKTSEKIYLSNLITDSFQIIPLETKEQSIIGRINKIKKVDNHFYILSNDQWIFHFDQSGKYISSLKKRGDGPSEYTYINDFDICKNNNNLEVWIADNNKIKIYDATNLSFKKEITFPFIVSKFKRMNKDEIIIMNGQSDKAIFITNNNGEIIDSFLNKEIAFLLFRAIQFKQFKQTSYIFQLGISNDYISYNSENHKFESGSFFHTKNKLLSQNSLKELFNKYGQNFVTHFKDQKYIQSFVNLNNTTWFYINDKDKKYISKTTSNKETISALIQPKQNIVNDLFNINDFTFLTSIGFGESENSLLLYMDLSSLPEGINELIIKDKDIIPISKDDNPYLIDFFLK